jgi:hypothetical protein
VAVPAIRRPSVGSGLQQMKYEGILPRRQFMEGTIIFDYLLRVASEDGRRAATV